MIQIKCDYCIHKNVCMYKEEFKKELNKDNGFKSTHDEITKKLPVLKIVVGCSLYRSKLLSKIPPIR